MDTSYDIRAVPQSASEMADPVMRSGPTVDQRVVDATMGRVLAHFALRRSSLRRWAAVWAETHSTVSDPLHAQRVYTLIRMVLLRWSGREGWPQPGTLGRRLWIALAHEVGTDVLALPPDPEEIAS